MDPLSVIASVIAVLQLSTKVLGYLNNVKDASKDCMEYAAETANLCSLFFSLRSHLESKDTSDPWYAAVRGLTVTNGPLDQFRQGLEMLQEKMTDEGRLKKAGKVLMWKFNKDEMKEVLDRMERLKQLVVIALQRDHFKLSQALKEDTESIRTHLSNIQSGVDTIVQDQDSTNSHRLLNWISASDYPAQQSDIMKRMQEGTGQWFLDSHELARWLNTSKATLFCPGMPGAGKTMIAAIVIDHLLNTVQDSSHGVAYVYCNYNAGKEQDVSSLLAAVIKQLVQDQISAVNPVDRLHRKHVNKGTKPSPEEIYSTLEDVLTSFQTVYMVIDALDECRENTGLEFLIKLRKLQITQDVRLIVTSRLIPDIENALKEVPILNVQADRDDVRRYVIGQTSLLPSCIKRSIGLQEEMQEKIVDAVEGMFLLAYLHINSLKDKWTAKDVRKALSTIKKGNDAVDAAYEQAFQRIESQSDGRRQLARKVLSWITLAKRPLTTAEICCALAVELDEDEIDPENVLTSEDLVSVCAGLVVVDKESDIIRLAHYTAQEYFQRTWKMWKLEGQAYIATICLKYLSFSVFQSGSCSTDKEFEERLLQHEFLDYAAKNWGCHARANEAKVAMLASQLLRGNSFQSVVQVLGVWNFNYTGYHARYRAMTALHYTAQFGLPVITLEILPATKHGILEAINARDSEGSTPLITAVESGQLEVVRLLLDMGADIDAQGGYYGNALQSASAAGRQAIVQLLLDNGADVNKQGGPYSNALNAAVVGNCTGIVELLIKNSADILRHDGRMRSVLHYATDSAYCSLTLVDFLLSQGAPANTTDIENMTPLLYSIKHRRKSIAALLFDSGLSIDSRVCRKPPPQKTVQTETNHQSSIQESEPDILRTSVGLTPLHFVALTGNLPMTEFLLNRGADPNALSENSESPIHLTLRQTLRGPKYDDEWSSPYCRKEYGLDVLELDEVDMDSVRADITTSRNGLLDALLADTRTSLTLRDCEHESPLHCVQYGTAGSAQMVEKLVFRGANPLAGNLKQQNALHIASQAGDHEAVAFLLSLGVEPTLTDVEGLNALHYAARSGDHGTVAILLGASMATQGSLLTSKDNSGRNSLHHLLSTNKAQYETVHLLLDNGVDSSELDDSGNSSLATYFQRRKGVPTVEICQQLLSIKGNASFIDSKGQNLGHLCISRWQLCTFHWESCVKILEALREQGVDLTQKDLEGRTLLHCAAIRGSITEDSLNYLLQVGIDIDAEDVYGKIALHHAAETGKRLKSKRPRIMMVERWDGIVKLLLASRTVKN